MRYLRDLFNEWAARRRGAKFVSKDIQKAARHIVGPTGAMFSNGWTHLEDKQAAYLRSFDPRVPPSIHVSERDLTRANLPVPLVERCIEDWNAPAEDHESRQPTDEP